MSRDPEGYSDSLNLYCFVNNNPVCYLDPWGECIFCDIWDYGKAIVGAVVEAPFTLEFWVRYGAYWVGVGEGIWTAAKEAVLMLWDGGQAIYGAIGVGLYAAGVIDEPWEIVPRSSLGKWATKRNQEAPMRDAGDAVTRMGEGFELWGRSYVDRFEAILRAGRSDDLEDVRAAGHAAGSLAFEAAMWGSLFTKGIIPPWMKGTREVIVPRTVLHHGTPKQVIKAYPRFRPEIIGRRGMPNKIRVAEDLHIFAHQGKLKGLPKYNKEFFSRIRSIRSERGSLRGQDFWDIRSGMLKDYFRIGE